MSFVGLLSLIKVENWRARKGNEVSNLEGYKDNSTFFPILSRLTSHPISPKDPLNFYLKKNESFMTIVEKSYKILLLLWSLE